MNSDSEDEGSLIQPDETPPSNKPMAKDREPTAESGSAVTTTGSTAARPWWKDVVCYQIWPTSFQDSNGDGRGDIRGVIQRLDYLKGLGVDVIWMSPTYQSPCKDWGYDISDYEAIDPKYGTMGDMRELIEKVHEKGMKILLDLVVTHTSDEHDWFRESKASRDNPKADWYMWKDKRPGHTINGKLVEEPSNWKAAFGGSAWTYVPERDQYYLHLFLDSQPDLNWECQEMKTALYKSAIKYWLKQGIDGYRIDTANRFSKHPDLPDVEPEGANISRRLQPGSKYYINGPKMHEYMKDMRRFMEEHSDGRDLMLVGELPLTPEADVLRYVSPAERELSMVFDFDVVKLGHHDNPDEFDKHEVMHYSDNDPSYTLPLFKEKLQKVQRLISEKGAWGTLFMENHDQPRCITRYTTSDPQYWRRAGKLLALLQTTLSGTLFIYQGQEIGMQNMPESWSPNEFRDPDAHTYIADYIRDHPEDRFARETAIQGVFKVGRDNSRTPMQWDASPNAGFTGLNPTWMRVNENYTWLNVAAQQADPESIWTFWKDGIAMRKKFAALFMHGTFACHDAANEHVFTYSKMADDGGDMAVAILNFSDTVQTLNMVQRHLLGGHGKRELLASNVRDEKTPGQPRDMLPLEPWEGRVYLLKQNS